MRTDSYFLELCSRLSKRAAAKGNPPAGAVITLHDEIISEAEEASTTKNDITSHAEIEAIRIALQKLGTNNLSECVLYSTHEPCIMCAYAIRYHKISKVVYQHSVSYFGSVSSSMPALTTDDVPKHWSKPPVIIQAAT